MEVLDPLELGLLEVVTILMCVIEVVPMNANFTHFFVYKTRFRVL